MTALCWQPHHRSRRTVNVLGFMAGTRVPSTNSSSKRCPPSSRTQLDATLRLIPNPKLAPVLPLENRFAQMKLSTNKAPGRLAVQGPLPNSALDPTALPYRWVIAAPAMKTLYRGRCPGNLMPCREPDGAAAQRQPFGGRGRSLQQCT
jgi:hypothetical protein